MNFIIDNLAIIACVIITGFCLWLMRENLKLHDKYLRVLRLNKQLKEHAHYTEHQCNVMVELRNKRIDYQKKNIIKLKEENDNLKYLLDSKDSF